jgi:hypothetical protein
MTMGAAIGTAWISLIAVTIAVFRQSFSDPVMGWAIRIGILITVFGTATGGLMTSPTKGQLNDAKFTHHMTVAGAHTVGAPDGGPGIPGTGWSREHGDLRVPHFFGMHGMQIFPLLAWLLKPKRSGVIIALGFAYTAVFVTLVVQAMAGKPLLGGL